MVFGLIAFGLLLLVRSVIVLAESVELRRRLREAATVTVAGLPEHGVVRISGKAERVRAAPGAPSTLHSPLGRKPCVYWSVSMSERGYKSSHTLLSRDTKATPFSINDGTGEIWVLPAEAVAITTSHARFMSYQQMAGGVLRDLKRLGASLPHAPKDASVSESYIAVGAPVRAVGQVIPFGAGWALSAGAERFPLLIDAGHGDATQPAPVNTFAIWMLLLGLALLGAGCALV